MMIISTQLRYAAVAVWAGGVFVLGSPQSGSAADLGGDCCADLEERVAELEATAARKGNRPLSLEVTGSIHAAIMYADDRVERNTYVVGNSNDSVDQSNFKILGEATINSDLAAGYKVTLRVNSSLSGEVSQDTDEGDSPAIIVWESYWFLTSKTVGQVSLGQASRASDGAPENDLSGTATAAFAGVHSIGGGFFLRRSDGDLSALSLGDIVNHFNGDTANVVRYDSPSLAGFVASVSWGEDDIWDAGLKFEGEGGGLKVASTIAYTEITDTDGQFADVEQSTIVGSIAVLHEPSGLNALVAAGYREFDAAVEDADGLFRTPADASFVYTKVGWLASLNGLGATAFYGEYGWFEDFTTAGLDGDGVASVAASGAFDCAAAGGACRVTGNEAEVWGAGVVQHIDAAEMQVYIGYRRHTADFDLVDGDGNQAEAADIEDFDTVIAGSKIAF